MSVFGLILVRILPHSDWIRTRITPNTDTFYRAIDKDSYFCSPLSEHPLSNVLQYRKHVLWRLIFRIVVRKCSLKKAFLKDFANFAGKHLCLSLFLIKFLIEKRLHPTKVFSYEFSEMFKNSYFVIHQRAVVSNVNSCEQVCGVRF